MSTHSAALLYR
uniref:Uncharacterized protein n=1 Tax=Anguilla anguilla TaxID=7936 RepID=A0A0E9VUN0_ANGAN